MRALERAAGGAVARPRFAQILAVAILDLDRRRIAERRLDPAV